MRLAVWANWYKCPYYDEWVEALQNQGDQDFTACALIEPIIDNFDAVLCLDIDDTPEPDLVRVAKINVKLYDITAFAMTMFGDREGYFGTERPLDLDMHNIWGFGNTVWKAEILKEFLPIPDVKYPDWHTIKRAQAAGAHLHFEKLPLIRYRQYGQTKNLVRLGDEYVWGR